MKSWKFLILVAVFLAASISVYAADNVYFEDPVLEELVRKAVGKPTGVLTTKDVRTIEYLDGREYGIQAMQKLRDFAIQTRSGTLYPLDFNEHGVQFLQSLKGIEHLTNLKSLVLWNCFVEDISPLAELSGLSELILIGDVPEDLGPLAGLTNLEVLGLGWTTYSDIRVLVGMAERDVPQRWTPTEVPRNTPVEDLQYMHWGMSGRHDITPLAELTKLRCLFMGCFPFDDISPLAKLTHLEELYLPYSDISDLSPLIGLANLKTLDLTANQGVDITYLERISSLENLDLTGVELGAKMSLLVRLTNLKVLGLGENGISNINP